MSDANIPPVILVPILMAFVVLPIVGIWSMVVYQRKLNHARPEDEPKRTETSLEDDVDLLVSMKSPLLNEAEALRRTENER